MGVYRKHGRPEYTYDFQLRGHRFSGSTGTSNKRQAERVLEQKRSEAKESLRRDAQFLSVGPMTLDIAASRYWIENGQHLKNAASYRRFIGWLLAELGAKTTLDRITDSMVAAMIAKRRAEGVTNATVNRTVTVPLRGIMMRARRNWKVPVAEIDWQQHILREPKERVREASQLEEKRILGAMREDYAPAVEFALLTGCRRQEIVDLSWHRVDLEGRVFTVVGKGDKARFIPITDPVMALLMAELGRHPRAVFTYQAQRTTKGGLVRGNRYPLTLEGFKTAWRRYQKHAGVENFRFHDTRHTAATRVLRESNIKVVQQLLGHEDITTTAKYAHAMVDDVRAAMEAANRTKNHTDEGAEVPKTLSLTTKSA